MAIHRICAIFGLPCKRTTPVKKEHQSTFGAWFAQNNNTMSLGTILLIVLILMLVGAVPSWPHSRNWGYFPSGLLGVALIILIIMLLTGRL